ncbi:MAG: bacteriohemerythrin [Aquificaceae bacterium]
MRYMELTPDLYTGVKDMDDQHQGIVDRINTLANLLSADKLQEAINFYKNELLPFVVWHLQEEEKFMQEIGYPDFEEHQRHHKWVIDLFTKLGEEMQDKKQARQALAILTGWLYGHVGRVDKRYGEFHSKLHTPV